MVRLRQVVRGGLVLIFLAKVVVIIQVVKWWLGRLINNNASVQDSAKCGSVC